MKSGPTLFSLNSNHFLRHANGGERPRGPRGPSSQLGCGGGGVPAPPVLPGGGGLSGAGAGDRPGSGLFSGLGVRSLPVRQPRLAPFVFSKLPSSSVSGSLR